MRAEDDALLARFDREYLSGELGLSKATGRTYRWALRAIADETGMPLQQIGADHWRDYLRRSSDNPRTKALKLAAGKAFHRWDCLERSTSPNGILALRAPKHDPIVKPAISREDACVLLSCVTLPIEVRLVYLGLYAGLRIGEMATAVFDGDWIVVTGKRKAREVPAHPQVQRVTPMLLAAPAPTLWQIAACARALREDVGVAFTPHDLRRRFARELEEAEVPLEVIKALMGHTRDVTLGYTGGISRKRRVDAVAMIRYFEEVDPPPIAWQPSLI